MDFPLIVPPRPVAPLSGGTMTILVDGTIVAADPDRDALWLVDGAGTAARRIDLQPRDEPGRVVEGLPGAVFVALRNAGAVAQIDVAAGAVVARHSVCAAPRGLAWLQAQGTLAVACANGSLFRLNFDLTGLGGATVASATSTWLASDLRDVVAVGDDLYLSTFRDAKLMILGASGSLSPVALPDATMGKEVRNVAWRLARTPAGVAMLHQRSRTDVTLGRTLCGELVGEPPLFGGRSGEYRVPGGYIVRSVFTEVAAQAVVEQPIGDGEHFNPPILDLAVTTGGTWAVASGGLVVVGNGGPGRATYGVYATSVAWSGGVVIALSREPARLIWLLPTSSNLTMLRQLDLPGESVRSTADELFNNDSVAGLRCASCHPEGGEDGRVWNLARGPRRTPTLRGGLRGTAPFNWDGDLANMGLLLDEVMGRQMGEVGQSDERAEALVDWLDSLPRLPPQGELDPGAVARGRGLFDSARVGCSGCHSGPLGTNNATIDVGTGSPLQVPRLRELDSRRPYLHDGRAPRLEDVFAAQAGAVHHDGAAVLSAQERADLVAYLRSL